MLNTPLAPDTRATFDARYSVYAAGVQGALDVTAAVRSMASPVASEDGNGLSNSGGSKSSAVGLRDRLLRDARTERQRCLEVAEAAERRRAELRGMSSVAVQTAPALVFGGPEGETQPQRTPATYEVWSDEDEQAQVEALSALQMLFSNSSAGKESKDKLVQMDEVLRAMRGAREDLAAQLQSERARTDSAQQQVLCLEYELDGKENALSIAEEALSRRDDELKETMMRVQRLQEELYNVQDGRFTQSLEGRIHCLRVQLADREEQLEGKDRHITRLLNVLRHQRSVALESDSTMCGSCEDDPLFADAP